MTIVVNLPFKLFNIMMLLDKRKAIGLSGVFLEGIREKIELNGHKSRIKGRLNFPRQEFLIQSVDT